MVLLDGCLWLILVWLVHYCNETSRLELYSTFNQRAEGVDEASIRSECIVDGGSQLVQMPIICDARCRSHRESANE